VRAHAAWALGNISGHAARLALEYARTREPDPDAAGEINDALAAL
jgi:hypothetical protein